VNFFYLDASALGKRYALEMRTALINRLFDSIAKDRLMVLSISIGEMMSIIVRRHNAGFITSSSTPPARLKPDLLGQGQFSSPIDGIGLAAHIGLPGI
jgi:hypothetical protein